MHTQVTITEMTPARIISVIWFSLLMLTFSQKALAQDNRLLSFQGVLLDENNEPINETASLKFTMYMASTGVRQLWTETHPAVTISDGTFSVVLGETEELTVDFETEVWLGIQKGTDTEYTPRMRVTGVPHAFSSDYSHGMYGTTNVMPSDGFVGIGTIDPQYPLDAGNIRSRTDLIAGSTAKSGSVFIRDNTNAAKILLKSDGDTFFNGGHVGFGNEDPIYQVDVSGNVRARSGIIAGSEAKDGTVHIRDVSNKAKILLRSNGLSYFQGGYVGFGNEDPAFQVDASGNIRARSDLIAGSTAKDGSLYVRNISNQNKVLLRSNGDSYFTGGNVGIGTNSPQYALDVSGTIRGNNVSPSDKRFKTDITTIDNAVSKVNALRGVSYQWKKDAFPDMNFSDRRQIGLIAQEVEEILPELVFTGADGYKSVNYAQLVAVLVEAFKNQQSDISTLTSALGQLSNQVEALSKQNNGEDALIKEVKLTTEKP